MERVGRFEVVRELGRGGMGVVYEAVDPTLGRRLALKLIREDLAAPEALLRFGREAQAMARVRHANLVAVHEVGRAAQGPFIATELVEGESLDGRLRRGPLAPREAALLVAELADAVAALHAAGLLHRDLKPANLIVRPDGRPVLLDLGLVRDESAEALTRTGAMLGTPAYMAPEQAGGERARIGPVTDVYGLGAVLFAAVAARPPFEAPSLPNLITAVLTREPLWPTPAEGVPPELLAVLRRALAKQPEDRYPSAAALADELRRFAAGELSAPARSRRGPLVAAAGLVLVLGAAAALAVRSRDEPSGSPPARAAAITTARAPASADQGPALPDDPVQAIEAIEQAGGSTGAKIAKVEDWLRDHPDAGEFAPMRRVYLQLKLRRVAEAGPLGDEPRQGAGFQVAIHPGFELAAVPFGDALFAAQRWTPSNGPQTSRLGVLRPWDPMPDPLTKRALAPAVFTAIALRSRGEPLAVLGGAKRGGESFLRTIDLSVGESSLGPDLPTPVFPQPEALVSSADGALLAVARTTLPLGSDGKPSAALARQHVGLAVFRWEDVLAASRGEGSLEAVTERVLPYRIWDLTFVERTLFVACGQHDDMNFEYALARWSEADSWTTLTEPYTGDEPRVVLALAEREPPRLLLGRAASRSLTFHLLDARLTEVGQLDGKEAEPFTRALGEGFGGGVRSNVPAAHAGPPQGAVLAADGRVLFSISYTDGATVRETRSELRAWDLADERELADPLQFGPEPWRLKRVWLTNGERSLVLMWEALEGEKRARFGVVDVALTPP